MLISLAHKFIFVANLKCASSSIEQALGRYAEIRISQTQFGKHMDLSMISQRFMWVRQYVPFSEFLVFAVIRDPVDFILSLYNFHSDKEFDGMRQSSKGVPFDEFWAGWCQNTWQTKPQNLRFVDKHDRLRLTHLIEFSQLKTEFPELCRHLGVNAELGHVNQSQSILNREELTSQQIADIEKQYQDDQALIKSRPRIV